MSEQPGRISSSEYVFKVCVFTFLVMHLVFTLFPFYWMIVTAFKTKIEAYSLPPHLVPYRPTLENFWELFSGKSVSLRYFVNSLVIGGGAVAVSLLAGIPAGYSLSRFRLRTTNFILMFILTFQMFPAALLVIPLYGYFLRFGLLNTYIGLIVVDSTLCLPFSVWLLKGFFDTIPRELEEAGAMDGCNRLQILTKVIMPLIGPGVVAVGVYSFLVCWQEFIYGFTLANTEAVRPISPGISLYFLTIMSKRWEDLMTVLIVVIGPIILMYVFLQRYVVAGLTAGAVKE